MVFKDMGKRRFPLLKTTLRATDKGYGYGNKLGGVDKRGTSEEGEGEGEAAEKRVLFQLFQQADRKEIFAVLS